MKKSLFLTIAVTAAAVTSLVAIGYTQRPGSNDQEPSACISEATLQLSATPAEVALGQSTVVRWAVGIPANCRSMVVQLNGATVGATGSRTFTPGAPSIFTLKASIRRSGTYQQRTMTTPVRVLYPERVLINQNTPSPVSVLLGALASANYRQIIELCGVELDLTGRSNIVIPDRRSLIAAPACARGARNFGPRIFVTDRARGRRPLFVVTGDSVLISGFRLQGPTSGIASDDNKEKGIIVAPVAGAGPIRSIEISNMEILHWAGLGVQVVDNVELAERGRLFNTNEGAVRIINNFFHHNRHTQEGYGAEVSAGAYALIARNVFDENRHGIAGGSRNRTNNRDYSGYTARENLILTGGGLACSHGFWARLTAPDEFFRRRCWQTHQIDMHGDGNEWYSDSNWQCGTAGETMIIQRNTVLYSKGPAIKIRGNPADKAVVDGNVFRGTRGDIEQNGSCGGWGDNITRPIEVRPNNVFSADPMSQLGRCDFAGDGQLDDFMATGVTWWARSPVTGQWRYLNTMPERLSQISLERVDGDAICDVTPRRARPEMIPRTYSKSGTGPWAPVLVIQARN